MRSIFRPRFDLDALCESWEDPPFFSRKSTKKERNEHGKLVLNAEEWLKAIETGCRARKVDERYWPDVGRRFISEFALGRLEEVERVMTKVRGRAFTMDWRRFERAILAMNWDMETRKHTWWSTRKLAWVPESWGAPKPSITPVAPQAGIIPMFTRRAPKTMVAETTASSAPATSSRLYSSLFSSSKLREGAKKNNDAAATRPAPPKEASLARSLSSLFSTSRTSRSFSAEHSEGVEVEWLLIACTAVDALCTEYPQVMAVVAAVLLVVGSSTSQPALSTTTAACTRTMLTEIVKSWIRAPPKEAVDDPRQKKA